RLVKAILEGMQEGVLAVSPQGRITAANPAMLKLTDFQGDPVGRSPAELLRAPGLLNAIEEAGAGKPVTAEVVVTHPHRRTLLVNATPLGRPGGILVVVHDTTEVHRLHRMRRDFVANVSHELRNPIATIQAAVETLSDMGGLLGSSGPDEDGKALIATIERQTARMSAIVNDLLDLSRIESGQLKLKPEEIDAGEFIEGIVNGFKERADARGLRLRVDVEQDLATIFCDRTGLQTVLSNLLDNALKYTREGDEINVHAMQGNDGRAILEVADSGPGIEPKHLPRLFERFYRVDKGRSRDVGGTGLGLAIVKHLCAAMGGSVSVNSRVGSGTAFRVVLPCRKQSEPNL
ncbi:MAG: PAS domain-containing protein, partial [Deltaproteobacteria bacterium]|nr:PAS domain-containing protein [Deltaproteobacteria bacterium]